jgi:hypothetical protein
MLGNNVCSFSSVCASLSAKSPSPLYPLPSTTNGYQLHDFALATVHWLHKDSNNMAVGHVAADTVTGFHQTNHHQ